jgi:ribosomal-protein-alanine N-acetyltransferase
MELNLDVFTAFPELESRRLFLRELQDSDADAIQAMRSSKAVNRFIARNDTITSEEAQNLTEKSRQAFENRTGIAWAGVRKGTDAFIGACGFNRIDFQNLRAEIGGEMSSDFWGRKLAIEAVAAIVAFGFQELGLHSVEARLDPANRSAIALLESLGFVKEAHFREYVYFRDAFRDLVVYTCHRSESQAP